MNPLWGAVGAAVVLLLAFGLSYNRFVEQRNLMRDSWANIDAELRRRYDLIPNLVETVKGYAKHERSVIEGVTAARAAALAATGAPAEQAGPENVLVLALRGLIAVAEQYPTLRASENFLSLQDALVDTEDRIQVARRVYNANVRDYNRRVASIPSSLVARLFGFRSAQFFEVEEAIRRAAAPSVAGESEDIAGPAP